MTEAPPRNLPAAAAAVDAIRRMSLPGWAVLGAGAIVIMAVLFLAGRPGSERAATPGMDDGRLAQLALRLDALETGIARMPDSLAGLTTRLTAAETHAHAGIQAQGQAVAALTTRTNQLWQRVESGFTQAEAEQSRRIEAQIATAVTGLERRFAELEARLRAVVTEEALRAALHAGRPLGPMLDSLTTPPPPLARFARVGAPTEAQLRLGFAEAARAARAAAHARGGLLEATWLRLSALVMLRRTPQSLWSDAAETELEGAGLALGEGDLTGVAERLARLPAVSQEAMAEWMAALRSVVEARAALASLRTG